MLAEERPVQARKEPTVIETSELVDFLEVPLEKLLELGIKSHKACLLL